MHITVSDEAPVRIHPSAVVDSGASVGSGTSIWHFCHVSADARIGERCVLGQGCFVADGAVVGNGVRVQNHVSIFDGVVLEDDVFVGPGATFTNVKNPRAAVSRKGSFLRTVVRRGATIGANATIVCGVELGEHCFVAAGAVVTRSVPAFALVRGVPARPDGWVSRHGERLAIDAAGRATCPATGEQYELVRGALALRSERR